MRRLALAALAAALPQTGIGETVLDGDHVIHGSLCVGTACPSSGVTFPYPPLKLMHVTPNIHIFDTSTSAGFPSNDWRLIFNEDFQGGADVFKLENASRGTVPFQVAGGALPGSLTVGEHALEPRVGIGTGLPLVELHIASQIVPVLRLEQVANDAPTFVPYVWDIESGQSDIRFNDETAGTYPVIFGAGAPDSTLRIASDGKIGLGTYTPETALHLWRDDGKAQARIEETSVHTTPRTLLDLRNNGRAEIAMGNTDTDGEWSFGAGTDFVMKFGAIGSRSAAKTKHLTLYSGSGDLEITGKLITTGPACTTGCDAVFAPGYDLPSIPDHAAQMYRLGHLPNVGPTLPGQAMNVSDKLGQVLNELEHAHIYIAQLETRLAALEAARN
ncbi:MAG: hypothetical protein R3D85_14820 [Paracoccaceae bacterium]